MFWAKGYNGASFRDLTSAMGISAPSLVAAFGDKRGLFDAAVARYVETIVVAPFSALEGDGALRDQLTAFFAAVIANSATDGQPTGCLITCALAEAAGDDAVASTRLRMLVAAADEQLTQKFAAAGFDTETARGRAQIAVATMQSLSLRARAGAPREELQNVSDAAVGLLSVT